MIIVEGPDCIGKTTFCRKIIQVINTRPDLRPVVYHHLSRLPDTWHYPQDYLPLIAPNVVQDRFHMSEVAYGYENWGNPRLDPEDYRWVDARLRLIGAFTVVLYFEHNDLIRERCQHDKMFNVRQLIRVNQRFKLLTGLNPVSAELPYRVDWDMALSIEHDEYPTDLDVHRVVEAWKMRQQCVTHRSSW